MDLSIIIVSWNVRDLLNKCLQSIYDQTTDLDFEVIVIDNGSTDNSAQMVGDNFAQVNLIASPDNLGFAKANNLGLEQAQGNFILFMNPDMELVENSFKIMFDVMLSDNQIALATGQLIYPDGQKQNNIKNNPTLGDQLLILLKLHHFIQPKCLKKYLAKDFNYFEEQLVQQIMGAFIYSRTEIMRQVGGWSEDYFLWWEDLDLCKRIQDLGYKIIYTPKTKIIHYEGKSFAQQLSLAKQKRFNRGMATYFRQHVGLFSYLVIKLLSLISLGLAWITQIFEIQPKTQSKV